MKRILAFVLVILMAASILWGCQKSDSQPSETESSGELTEALEDEIIAAMLKEYENGLVEYLTGNDQGREDPYIQVELPLAWRHEYDFGLVYLGYDNGYYIFYHNQGAGRTGIEEYDPPNLVLGEVSFDDIRSVDCVWMNFLTYKDGKIDYLQNLYDDGKISQQIAYEIKAAIEAYRDDISDERAEAGRIRYIREHGALLGQVDGYDIIYYNSQSDLLELPDFVLDHVTFEGAHWTELYAFKEDPIEFNYLWGIGEGKAFTQEFLLELRDAYLACRGENAK